MWKKIEVPIFGRFSEFNTNDWQLWAVCPQCPNSVRVDVAKLISKYGDREGFKDIGHVFACSNCGYQGANPKVCMNYKNGD